MIEFKYWLINILDFLGSLNFYIYLHTLEENFFFFLIGYADFSLLGQNFFQLWLAGATFQLHYEGFSLQQLLLLQTTGSRVRTLVILECGLKSCSSWTLEHRISSYGAQTQLPCGIWGLHRARIEPMSPALTGGSLTTGPLGKPGNRFYFVNMCYSI